MRFFIPGSDDPGNDVSSLRDFYNNIPADYCLSIPFMFKKYFMPVDYSGALHLIDFVKLLPTDITPLCGYQYLLKKYL